MSFEDGWTEAGERQFTIREEAGPSAWAVTFTVAPGRSHLVVAVQDEAGRDLAGMQVTAEDFAALAAAVDGESSPANTSRVTGEGGKSDG